MHSGVYSKSETPVNLTLTSSPVESLGSTVMVSLMFWGGKHKAGGLLRNLHPESRSPGAPRDTGGDFWGGGHAPHLLEVELQPLGRLAGGLGGQDAIPCKAAPSAPPREPATPPGTGTPRDLTQMCHELLGRDHLLLRRQLHLEAHRGWGQSPGPCRL